MPIEFMFGRPLSPEELDMIRLKIESVDDITAIDAEVRGIVERKWPQLVSKLPGMRTASPSRPHWPR